MGHRARVISPAMLACALGAVLAVAAGDAIASPSAKLTYLRRDGAESCPDEGELRRAVAARLGYDPFFPTATKTVVAEIGRASKGFRATVQIVDDEGIVRGERALVSKSDDCGEMVRALALGISIAIDDLEVSVPTPRDETAPAPPPSSPPAPTPPPSPPALPPSAPPAAPPPAPASSALAVEARLGVRASAGLAPAVSLGGFAGLGLVWRDLSVGVEGLGDLPASASADVGGRVSASLLALSVVPCWRPAVAFVCGVAMFGSYRGAGVEGIAPRAESAFFSAIGGRVGARVPIAGPFSAALHLDVLAPLTRHRVEISGQTAYTVPAVAGSIGLAAEMLFR